MDVHLFRKLEVEPAPMLLPFILGPMMQQFLRRTFLVSKSAPSILSTRPLSAGLLLIAAIMLLMVVLSSVRKKCEEAFHDGCRSKEEAVTAGQSSARRAHRETRVNIETAS